MVYKEPHIAGGSKGILYPYEKYNEELANKHGVRTVKGGYSGFNKGYLEKLLYKAIDEEFLKGSTVNTVSN